MNRKYEEIKVGVEKLHQTKYIHNYWEDVDSDTGIKFLGIEFGDSTVSTSKGGYNTVNRIKSECKKRNIFYIDDSTYNRMKIYEEDPLDVFPVFEEGDD